MLVAVLAAGCASLHLDRGHSVEPVWATEGETPLRGNAVSDPIPPPLVERWDFNAGAGFGSVSPLVVGDVVFVATRKGEVHAIDVESGRRVGQASFGESIEGTPVFTNGTLVVPIAWGGVALHAHDLFRGTRRWRVKGAPVSSGLLVHGRSVIAGDVEGYVRAYALDDGTELWTRRLDERSGIYSTPVLNGDRLVVANDRGLIAALRADDGSLIWTADAGAPVQVALAANDGLVFASTTRGRLLAFDLASGDVRWEYALPATDVYFTPPAVGTTDVVFGASDGIVRSLDVEDGAPRWNADVSGAVSAPPVITDDVVYVGTMESKLVALNRDDGDALWEEQLEGRIKSAFAVTDSRLVVMAEPRLVHLFEPSSDSYATRPK